MIYININGMLQKKRKTKYWFVKNMGSNYQTLSRLMNNETQGIKFETLDKICEIFECEPGDIIIRKTKTRRKKSKK